MSVIGDALRRAEEECTVAAPADVNRPARTCMSAKGIAHEDAWSVTADRSSPWLSVALVGVVAAVVGVIVWPAWSGAGRVEVDAIRTTIQSTSPERSRTGLAQVARNSRSDKAKRETVLSVGADLAQSAASNHLSPPAPAPALAPTPVQRAQPRETTSDSQPQRSDVRVERADSTIAKRFRLEGVMLGGQSRLAVVNGAIVEEGQYLDGAVIRTISRKYVVIELDGKQHRIPLRAASRKKGG